MIVHGLCLALIVLHVFFSRHISCNWAAGQTPENRGSASPEATGTAEGFAEWVLQCRTGGKCASITFMHSNESRSLCNLVAHECKQCRLFCCIHPCRSKLGKYGNFKVRNSSHCTLKKQNTLGINLGHLIAHDDFGCLLHLIFYMPLLASQPFRRDCSWKYKNFVFICASKQLGLFFYSITYCGILLSTSCRVGAARHEIWNKICLL